jgi:IS5 family transposase
MKAHIGVDAHSGLVHSVADTPANVNDLNMAGALLHGEEEAAFGDAGYQGVHKRPRGGWADVARRHAPAAQTPQPVHRTRLRG